MDFKKMIQQEDLIEDKKEDTPLSKTQLVKILFDKNNPEMITYLKGNEIDKIAMLKILSKNENLLRLSLGINNLNPMEELIQEHLILRTSIKGTRAEQGVKIITTALNEEEQNENTNLQNNLKKILRG